MLRVVAAITMCGYPIRSRVRHLSEITCKLVRQVPTGGLQVDMPAECPYDFRVLHSERGSEIFVYDDATRELLAYSSTSSDKDYYSDMHEFMHDFWPYDAGGAEIETLS